LTPAGLLLAESKIVEKWYCWRGKEKEYLADPKKIVGLSGFAGSRIPESK
jgi:hypothetical protein